MEGFVPLVSLDAQYGVVVDEEGGMVWAKADGDELVMFAVGDEPHFVEVLEHPRRDFDAMIESGAKEHELAPTDALFSFPVFELVAAMLKTTAHYKYLALQWILPSELRELRDDIKPLCDDRSLPVHVRDLAKRLWVP